jgi:predicted negative regulator of RcsB-dependent stress response
MKRVERKQLKEDEFVSGIGTFLDLLKKWAKEILIAAGVLAFLVLVFLGLTALKNRGLRKESRVVGEIIALRADLDKKPENLARLEKLAGGGRFARVAYLELATYWMEKGDLEKAEKWAGEVKSATRDVLYYEAQELLAQIALKKKDFAKALDIYKKIEEEKPKSYPLDAVLFHKGEALQLKGDIKEALAVFKKLQEEYSQTYYGYEASLKVGKLEGAR